MDNIFASLVLHCWSSSEYSVSGSSSTWFIYVLCSNCLMDLPTEGKLSNVLLRRTGPLFDFTWNRVQSIVKVNHTKETYFEQIMMKAHNAYKWKCENFKIFNIESGSSSYRNISSAFHNLRECWKIVFPLERFSIGDWKSSSMSFWLTVYMK